MTHQAADVLPGRFVVEIGIRQTWPYLTFADNSDAATVPEIRLYIDSTFNITPVPAELGAGDEDDEKLWLLCLAEVLNLTVQDVIVEGDATLVVNFHDDVRLNVSGRAAPWTTHDVWWLAAIQAGTPQADQAT